MSASLEGASVQANELPVTLGIYSNLTVTVNTKTKPDSPYL